MRRISVGADRTAGRLKLAELTSTLGAGVMGASGGLLLAPTLRDLLIPIFALGLLMHAWGMTDKHAIEARSTAPRVRWATALYWLCWIALLVMAGYAALRVL